MAAIAISVTVVGCVVVGGIVVVVVVFVVDAVVVVAMVVVVVAVVVVVVVTGSETRLCWTGEKIIVIMPLTKFFD